MIRASGARGPRFDSALSPWSDSSTFFFPGFFLPSKFSKPAHVSSTETTARAEHRGASLPSCVASYTTPFNTTAWVHPSASHSLLALLRRNSPRRWQPCDALGRGFGATADASHPLRVDEPSKVSSMRWQSEELGDVHPDGARAAVRRRAGPRTDWLRKDPWRLRVREADARDGRV